MRFAGVQAERLYLVLWCSTLHHHGRSSSYHRDPSVVTFWLEFGFNLVIAFLFCYAAPAPRSCNGSKPPRSNAGARVRTRALQNPTSALRCWESYGAHDRFYNQKEAFTKYRPCTPVWLFPMPAHKRGQFCWTYFWEHVECSTDMEVLAASERWDVIHDSSLPAYICGTFRSRNIYKPLPAISINARGIFSETTPTFTFLRAGGWQLVAHFLPSQLPTGGQSWWENMFETSWYP